MIILFLAKSLCDKRIICMRWIHTRYYDFIQRSSLEISYKIHVTCSQSGLFCKFFVVHWRSVLIGFNYIQDWNRIYSINIMRRVFWTIMTTLSQNRNKLSEHVANMLQFSVAFFYFLINFSKLHVHFVFTSITCGNW